MNVTEELKNEIIEEVKLLKDIHDCVGIEIGDGKGLFIQVDNYDGDKTYFIELNDVDEEYVYEPCAEYNAVSRFGDTEELIRVIELYLEDVL